MLKTKILKLLSIILVIGLVFSTMPTIFAEGDTTTTEVSTSKDATSEEESTSENVTVSAGIKPDSILYVFDKLLENIQIALTIDEAKKTLLLITISEERLAEAEYLINLAENKEVDEEEWNQLLQNVVDDYKDKVDKALEITERIAYETDDDTKAELDKIIETINSTINFDSEALKNNDQINEIKDSALLVANIVSDLDQEKVAEIRDLGAGYGQISQIFALSETTGKDLDEVAALFTEDKMGLGQATKELGIKTSDFAKIKKSTTLNADDINDETENNDFNNENETAVKLNNTFNNNGMTSENQSKNEIKGNQDNIVEENEEVDEIDETDEVNENTDSDVNDIANNLENNKNNSSDANKKDSSSNNGMTNDNTSIDKNNNSSKTNGNSDNANNKNR